MTLSKRTVPRRWGHEVPFSTTMGAPISILLRFQARAVHTPAISESCQLGNIELMLQ